MAINQKINFQQFLEGFTKKPRKQYPKAEKLNILDEPDIEIQTVNIKPSVIEEVVNIVDENKDTPLVLSSKMDIEPPFEREIFATEIVEEAKTKRPKCKKGTRRNKITGLCEKTNKGTKKNKSSKSTSSSSGSL